MSKLKIGKFYCLEASWAHNCWGVSSDPRTAGSADYDSDHIVQIDELFILLDTKTDEEIRPELAILDSRDRSTRDQPEAKFCAGFARLDAWIRVLTKNGVVGWILYSTTNTRLVCCD